MRRVLVLESAKPPPAPVDRASVAARLRRRAARARRSSTRRRRASPAACRWSRACWRSRCTRRMSCVSRSSASSTAWALRRCRRRTRISSPRWAAPTTRSSSAAACICSSPDRPRRRATWPKRCRARGSRDYGRPFAEIFRRRQGRFLRDRSDAVQPGRGDRHAVESGESFRAGGIDAALLDASFG